MYPDIDRYDESLDWDLMELDAALDMLDEIPFESEEENDSKSRI